jgi:hypothetical protein
MPRLYKKLVLIVLGSIFFASGTFFILSALGWIPDLKSFRIVRTGSLYVKFAPSDATLYVDAKPFKLRSFTGGGLLVNGLSPKEYNLRLTKEGFNDWLKKLVVSPGKVTVANKIKLWPRYFETETIASGTVDFWPTKNGLIRLNGNGEIFLEKVKLRGNELILANPESNLIVTKNKDGFFLFNLDTPFAATNLEELFNSLKRRELAIGGFLPIEQIAYHPFSPQKLILKTRFSIYVIDLKKVELERIFTASTTNTFTISSNEIFILETNGRLTAANLLFNSLSDITPSPATELSAAKKITATPSGENLLILSKNNNLFLYERSGRTILPIAKNVSDFSLSPDEKRLFAVNTAGKISIIFIDDYRANDDSLIKAGTIMDLPFNSADGEIPVWLADEPNYALLKSGGDLRIIEMDLRPPVNEYPVATGTKKYVLNGDKLFVLKNDGELLALNLSP